jgi:hypothetical protein
MDTKSPLTFSGPNKFFAGLPAVLVEEMKAELQNGGNCIQAEYLRGPNACVGGKILANRNKYLRCIYVRN